MRILNDLLVDGRKSSALIAKELGVTKEVLYQNYRELEQAGVISGATIQINYRSFGYKAVAVLLITVEPHHTFPMLMYVQKLPDLYTAYNQGPGGNIRIVVALKTLVQLDEIKDAIKQRFSILDLKSVIWTDVREIMTNLAIFSQEPIRKHDEKSPPLKVPIVNPVLQDSLKIDETDLKIAEWLSINGQMPFSKIAEKIGISINSVVRRYNILKKKGAMKVTIQIDLRKIGYRALAIFYATFALKADSSLIIDQLSQIPDVINIMKTSGDYDLAVYVMVKDIDQLLFIQGEFTKIPGIAKMDLDLGPLLGIWPTPRQYISTF